MANESGGGQTESIMVTWWRCGVADPLLRGSRYGWVELGLECPGRRGLKPRRLAVPGPAGVFLSSVHWILGVKLGGIDS